MEELLIMTGTLVAKTTVAAGVTWMAWRWIRSKGREMEQAFQDQMTCDAAELLSQHLRLSRNQVEAALRARLERGEATPLLDRVLRVECVLARTPRATIYRRKLSVLVQDSDDALILESTRDVRREQLPRDVRAAFIHSSSDVQAYVVFDKNTTPAGSRAEEPHVSSAVIDSLTTTGRDRPRRDQP
jgi:hypothetical protein